MLNAKKEYFKCKKEYFECRRFSVTIGRDGESSLRLERLSTSDGGTFVCQVNITIILITFTIIILILNHHHHHLNP